MKNNRPLAVAALVLATLAGLIVGDNLRSPFPIPLGAPVYLEYTVQPLDDGIYIITDRAAVEQVLACLNETGAGIREFDRSGPSLLERDYEVRFLRPDGKWFSMLVWEEGALELRGRETWVVRTDTGPLCALLEKILLARSSGALE